MGNYVRNHIGNSTGNHMGNYIGSGLKLLYSFPYCFLYSFLHIFPYSFPCSSPYSFLDSSLRSFLHRIFQYGLENYGNGYRKSSAECKSHDENVFFKADRALTKFNFLFNLKQKKNVVTLRKCNLHLQYYKIDLRFSIKLLDL